MAQTVQHVIRREREIPGGHEVLLDFGRNGDRLPALLRLPHSKGKAPVALLLHGLSLDKERMADMAAPALLRRGIACMAFDLPLHGERGCGKDPSEPGGPFEMLRNWRASLDESTLALEYLSQRAECDSERLYVLGYSLGAFIGLKVASGDPQVRALILAGGGDLPDHTPFIGIVRAMADPLKMVRGLRGRPLLMLHGKYDRAVTPAQADRLFNAATEPKKMIWWECGHVLPQPAMDEAAAWLAGL